MERQLVQEALASILEELARIERERWSHWQSYMHQLGTRQMDGSLFIPPDLVQRWDQQIASP